MKSKILITLMTVAAIGIVNQRALFVTAAEAFAGPAASNRSAVLAQRSSELIIPQVLPSGIQDPILLEAWVRLYNHQEPIQLWDGSTLTGRELAQFVLENTIPIVWDTAKVCAGGSCSVQYCYEATWTYRDGQAGVNPIYIAPVAQPIGANMQFLVGTMAHEIFHRTQPFGAVQDTKFEEYWAFRIGAQIGKNAAPNFSGFDPLISGHLFLWLLKNGMRAYYVLPEYPPSVAALVQSHS